MEIIHVSKNPCKSKWFKLKRAILSDKNNNSGAKAIKKCLFGAPELGKVEEMLQEQIREDRERLKHNFGIDVEDLENMENANRLFVTTPLRKRKLETKCISKRRKLFSASSERKITDYFQVRKNVQHEKNKEERSEETSKADADPAIGV